jgi:ribosome-binding protein aMBF1 (putative translation factor)
MKIAEDAGSGNQGTDEVVEIRTVLSNLASIVQKQRESMGFTIEDIAERTKISVGDLKSFELGEWDIDLVSLDSIAACLNVKLKVVFISTEALAAKTKKKRD